MSKADQYRDRNLDDLDATYRELRKDLFQSRNALGGDNQDTMRTRRTRRSIARVLTVMREKQVTQGPTAKAGKEKS